MSHDQSHETKSKQVGKIQIPESLLAAEHFVWSILMPVCGILFIFFAPYLTDYIEYLAGSVLIVFGIVMFAHAIKTKAYANPETHNTAFSLILLICGIIVFFKDQEDCLTLLGIAWGLYSIISSMDSLTELFYQMANKETFVLVAIDCVVALVLAILLLWDPVEAFTVHVRLLGIELIIHSVSHSSVEDRKVMIEY